MHRLSILGIRCCTGISVEYIQLMLACCKQCLHDSHITTIEEQPPCQGDIPIPTCGKIEELVGCGNWNYTTYSISYSTCNMCRPFRHLVIKATCVVLTQWRLVHPSAITVAGSKTMVIYTNIQKIKIRSYCIGGKLVFYLFSVLSFFGSISLFCLIALFCL